MYAPVQRALSCKNSGTLADSPDWCKSFFLHVCTYHCTQCTLHSVLQTFWKTCKLHQAVLLWKSTYLDNAGHLPYSWLQPFLKKVCNWVRLTQVYKHLLFHGLRIIRLCLDLLLPSETIAEPAQTVTLQGCSERKRPQLVSRLLRNLGIFVTTVSCQFCLCFI